MKKKNYLELLRVKKPLYIETETYSIPEKLNLVEEHCFVKPRRSSWVISRYPTISMPRAQLCLFPSNSVALEVFVTAI